MSDAGQKLSRRKFITTGSAAIAAPFVMKISGAVPCVEAAEKEAEPQYAGMKSIVIYYSQSGNTKKIAQALQRGITRQTGQCDIARVKDIKPEELAKYDLIGIGAPTWSSCPSPIIIYFIKSLPPILQGKHFFWYSTHGILPGRCVIRGVQPLQEQGMTVIGWKDWYCSSSLPGHCKPWYTDGHPDEIDLAEAESFGAAMAVHSRKISDGQTDIIPALHSKEASDQIWGIGHPFIQFGAMRQSSTQATDSNTKTESKPYPLAIPTSRNYIRQLEGLPNSEAARSQTSLLRINKDKCIQCKRCVKGCPCYNIDDSIFPYVFKTQECERCMFCEGICPTGAIEYDFQPQDANAAKEHFAGMNLPLDLAEAAGRFRRLTKEEDIGWGTPWEAVTTHPRHKELP